SSPPSARRSRPSFRPTLRFGTRSGRPRECAMSLDGTYDDGNIFAKILRGEMPAARVFEDEHVFAFMDVFPQSKGHTLVIPKHSSARNLLDEEPQVLSEL